MTQANGSSGKNEKPGDHGRSCVRRGGKMNRADHQVKGPENDIICTCKIKSDAGFSNMTL